MGSQLQLGDISVEVTFTDIKNVHLTVHPPFGRVHISAPEHMKLDTIRLFAITKLSWIKQQRQKLKEQEREQPREFLNRESHYVWGKRYLLKIVEHDGTPFVVLKHNKILLHMRPSFDEAKASVVVENWYRSQVKVATIPLIQKWEPVMGVQVTRFFVQRMKTKWGSCTASARSIRLNTDLAKKPPECLEYIVVHEMTHLLEPTHNARFVALMDRYLPNWRFHRTVLNRLPVRHEQWSY